MPEQKGYGTGSKEMFDKALKDGLITKSQMTKLHPNLVVAIIKKKRGGGTGGAGASRLKGSTRKAKPSGPKNASKGKKGKGKK